MIIATLITAFAALATGIASFLMILEMKRQRTAISKPIIKILPKYFEAKTHNQKWLWENSENHKLKLKLLNFGAGAAINILVKWDINKEVLSKTLKHFDPYNQFKVEWGKDTFHCGNSVHMIQNQTSQRFEAAPIYNGENPSELIVPSFYKYAFERYVEFAFINRPENDSEKTISAFNLPEYPPINAIISYEDINGKKFKNLIVIDLQIYYVSSSDNDEGYIVWGNVEVTEKSV